MHGSPCVPSPASPTQSPLTRACCKRTGGGRSHAGGAEMLTAAQWLSLGPGPDLDSSWILESPFFCSLGPGGESCLGF